MFYVISLSQMEWETGVMFYSPPEQRLVGVASWPVEEDACDMVLVRQTHHPDTHGSEKMLRTRVEYRRLRSLASCWIQAVSEGKHHCAGLGVNNTCLVVNKAIPKGCVLGSGRWVPS